MKKRNRKSRTRQPARASRSRRRRGVTKVTHVTQHPQSPRGARGEEVKSDSQAKRLLCITESLSLFHTPENEAFVSLPINGHLEHWPVASEYVVLWLQARFLEEFQSLPSPTAIEQVVGRLKFEASSNPDVQRVHVRVAWHEGRLYLDLANAKWEAVEIDPDSWRVIPNSPVPFRRSRGILPLPTPEEGGNANELARFLNIGGDDAFKLVVADLVSSFDPRAPHPILVLTGARGTAKSSTARILRALLDPNAAPLRSLPRSDRDLMIAAGNSRMLAYDNVSVLQPWLSDALCRLATGAGFATKALYTDRDELLIQSRVPIILNGIGGFVVRGDLIDRSIIIDCPIIPPLKRKEETAIARAFEEAHGRLMGAIMDALSGMLHNLDKVVLEELPRMADFARRGVALEMALGWEPGSFLRAYKDNLGQVEAAALESSPIWEPLCRLLQRGRWRGNARRLLSALNAELDEGQRVPSTCPRDERALGAMLRDLGPLLYNRGISIRQFAHGREWEIRDLRVADKRDDRDVRDVAGDGTDASGRPPLDPDGEQPGALP